jgi:serine protease AprX
MDVNGPHPQDGNVLRRRLVVLALGLLLVPLATIAAPSPATATPARIDALLAATLATASPTQQIEAAVVFTAPPTPLVLSLVRSTGLTTLPLHSLPMAIVRGTKSQLTAASLLAPVASMWGNHELELALHESTQLIQANDVWAAPLGYTGRGVRVAVLDSGIDGTHPDLLRPTKTVQNVKILGYQKYVSQTLTVEDVDDTDTTTGHGTHVAGIIAGDGSASGGYYRGVAPGADLVGVGAADGTDMLTVLAGYDWILSNRARYDIKVLNNSWADGTIAYDPADPLNVASKAAADAGITVVFAAGNDGQASGNVFNRYAWPEWVVSVGGGTKLGTLGDYSSAGDDVHHPTLIAPGSFIASARAGTGVVTDANSSPLDLNDPANPRIIAPEYTVHYTAAIGTSMSAPHVAGVVALMLEANPALTPAQIRTLLASTATPMPSCPVAFCGAGYVNALAAVRAALAAQNAAPVDSQTAPPVSGPAPLLVTLDASGSHDGDGSVVSYRYDLDGDSAVDLVTSSPVVTHLYGAGVFHPSVSAVDDDGVASMPVSVEVRSSQPPVAVAVAPAKAKSGTAVTFDASGSSDPDGSVVSYRFTFGDGASTTSSSPTVTHTYLAAHPTTFAWSVAVTDDAGVTDADGASLKITP